MRYRTDELYHYGVLGMRWGVHRAIKAYQKATRLGNADKQNKSLNKLDKHYSKIKRKIGDLNRDRKDLNRTNREFIEKYDVKAAKMAQKSAKLKARSIERSISEKKQISSLESRQSLM